MIVTSLDNQVEMLTDYTGVSIKRIAGGEQTLQFTLIKSERNAHSYNLVQDDSLINVEGESFVVKDVEDGPYTKTVVAISEFFDTIDDYVPTLYPNGLYTIQEALQLAFSTSDWTYAIGDSYPQRAKLEEFGQDNALSMLNKIVNAFNSAYEINTANKVVTVKRRLGYDTDYQIRYAHNLQVISKVVNSENVKTAVQLYYNADEFGNYNSNIIYRSPNESKYRKTKWRAPIYSDVITTEAQAISTARLILKDEPDVTITVEFAVLRENGYNSDDVQLGNSVWLIDERLGIRMLASITEIETFPYSMQSPIVTVSSFRDSVVNTIVNQQSKQATIEQTAVKQQAIYNGCMISKEEGFTTTASNGVKTYQNSTEGFRISVNDINQFFVDPINRQLTLDGRLLITSNQLPLFDAYLDEAGGIMKIYDAENKLNVAIGSNFFDTEYTGGSLKLYNDGSNQSDERVEMGIYRQDSSASADGEAGFVIFKDGNNNDRITIEGVSYSTGETRITLRNAAGTSETEIIAGAVYVDGERLITQAELDAEITTVTDRYDAEIEDLQDQINDLARDIRNLEP